MPALALIILSALVASALAAGVFVHGALAGWWIRKGAVAALAARLGPAMTLYRPEGEGPFPAVLQLSGCGGPTKAIQHDYAKAAQAAGVIGVVLDSHGPRGISYRKSLTTVCRGRLLRGGERAGDVVAGLAALRATPGVDASRLAVAGWSHGAWAIMDLLAMRLPAEQPHNLKDASPDAWAGVKGIYLTYPFCSFPALSLSRGWAKTDLPVDVLMVENDRLAKNADQRKALAKARASGARIAEETWPGLTHAFDEVDHEPNSGLVPDPDATARAHKRFQDWLRRTLLA